MVKKILSVLGLIRSPVPPDLIAPQASSDAGPLAARSGHDADNHHHHHHHGIIDVDELTHSVNVITSSIETLSQKGIKGYISVLKEQANLISTNPFASIKSNVIPQGTADTVVTVVVHLLNVFFGGWAARGGFAEGHEASHEAPELVKQTAAAEEKVSQLRQFVAQSAGYPRILREVELANAEEESADLAFRTGQNESLKGVARATSITGLAIATQSAVDLFSIAAIQLVINHLVHSPERRDAAQSGIEGVVGVINVILNLTAAFGALALGLKLVEGSGPQRKRFRQPEKETSVDDGSETDAVKEWRRFIHEKRAQRDRFYNFYHPMNTVFKTAGTPYVISRSLETSLPIVAAAAKKVSIPWEVVGIKDFTLILTGLIMFAGSVQLFKGHATQHRFVEAVNGSDSELDTHFLQIVDALCVHRSSSSHQAGNSKNQASLPLPEGLRLPRFSFEEDEALRTDSLRSDQQISSPLPEDLRLPRFSFEEDNGRRLSPSLSTSPALPETSGEQKTGEALRAGFLAQIKRQHELTDAFLRTLSGKGKTPGGLEKLLKDPRNVDMLKTYMDNMLKVQSETLSLKIEMKELLFCPPSPNMPLSGIPKAKPEVMEDEASTSGERRKTIPAVEQEFDRYAAVPGDWLDRLEQDKRRHLQMRSLQEKLAALTGSLDELANDINGFMDLRSDMPRVAAHQEDGYKRLAESLSDGNPEQKLEKLQDLMVEIDSRAEKNVRRITSSDDAVRDVGDMV